MVSIENNNPSKSILPQYSECCLLIKVDWNPMLWYLPEVLFFVYDKLASQQFDSRSMISFAWTNVCIS